MRKRRNSRTRSLCDAAFPANPTIFSIQDKTYDFWAAHTERSGVVMLDLLTCFFFPISALMAALHIFSGSLKVSSHEALVSLPNFVVYGLVWYKKQTLKCKLRAWPVVMGSIVQVAAHAFLLWAMISGALCMPTDLMQHRVFLTCYYSCVFLCSSVFFVPFPLYLLLICPLYVSGWFVFHGLENFLPPACLICGPLTIAAAMYCRHLENQGLEHAFETREALVKERQFLQMRRDSLQGILSSIFDASCTCDCDGLLLECSPHLREILGCSPVAETGEDEGSRTVLNLCSFAATAGECHRLEAFLKNAMGSAHEQAAKIDCCFHRRLGGLMEACMYAIVLRAASPSGDEEDVLFIALQTRGTDLDFRTQMPEQSVQASAEAPPEATNSRASIEDSRLLVNPSLLDQLQPSALVSRDSSSLEEATSFASFDSINKLGTLGSLSLSASMPSSTHAFDDVDISKGLCASVPSSSHRIKTVPHFQSVETLQDMAVAMVDREVQTIGSAARPPLLNRVPKELLQRHRKVPSRRRRSVFQAFRATPGHAIQQCILTAAISINPVCQPACCTLHTLLRFLRHSITSMLKTIPCSNSTRNEPVQCLTCLCLQERFHEEEEEEFVCDICSGTEACGPNAAFESIPSSAAADDENGHV